MPWSFEPPDVSSRDDILRRRLQQSHNVGDELVLALDGSQSVELVGTHVDSLLYVCALELRKNIVLLDEVFKQLGGALATSVNIREVDSFRAG